MKLDSARFCKAIVSGVVLLLLGPGCQIKRKHNPINVQDNRTVSSETVCVASDQRAALEEAFLVDVPLPLDLVRLPLDSAGQGTANEIVLRYKTHASQATLKDFFTERMEQAGWKFVHSFQAYVSAQLYLFKKPGTLCIVSLQKKNREDDTELIIYHGVKFEKNR